MKRINVLLIVFSLLTIGLVSQSCKKEESCPAINCNTGTMNKESCNCDCPNGYTGTNCESFDATQTQALLDGGKTPKELFDGGIALESLYGKTYAEGIIFYLNTDNGTGMVAAVEDQSDEAGWGCFGTNIIGLNNVASSPTNDPETAEGGRIGDGAQNTTAILAECTDDGIAAKVCRDLGSDWFLPSLGELNLMYTNLYEKGHGGFAPDYYWSSTEVGNFDAWFLFFDDGVHSVDYKTSKRLVRAARFF